VLLENEGDIDGAVSEMKQQIKHAAGYASRDVVPFGDMLIKKNHRDKAVEIYEVYLSSDVDKKTKCEVFKALDLASYNSYKQLLTLLESTCK